MYSSTRRTTLAVLLVAALVAVLGVCAQDYLLDGSTPLISGDLTASTLQFTEAFTDLSVSIAISRTTVGGAGVLFKGLGTSGTRTDTALTVQVSQMEVTGGTITCDMFWPKNTLVQFSQLSARDLTGPLFSLNSLTLDFNTTLIITAPTATWSSPAGASLIQGHSLDIRSRSALFVEEPAVDQAIASIYSDASSSMQISADSVFAIDAARCASCTGPMVNHAGSITVSDRSLYRITEANAGTGGIMSGTASVMSNSVMEISGTMPAGASGEILPDFHPTIGTDSRLVLGKLTGGSALGVSGATNGGTAYGYGTSTVGGQLMNTEDAWINAGVPPEVVVVDGNGQSLGTCPNVHCLTGTVLNVAGTCSCRCETGFQPYCTVMHDPIHLGGCSAKPPHCEEMDSECNCVDCEDGYVLVDGACHPITKCDVAHCKTCCSDLKRCCACDDGYVLEPTSNMECQPCTQRIPGCTQCLDWNTCGSCSATYQVVGNTCVRRTSDPVRSSSATTPTLVGLLLLVVSASATYFG